MRDKPILQTTKQLNKQDLHYGTLLILAFSCVLRNVISRALCPLTQSEIPKKTYQEGKNLNSNITTHSVKVIRGLFANYVLIQFKVIIAFSLIIVDSR